MDSAIDRIERALEEHKAWAAERRQRNTSAEFARFDVRDVEVVLATAIAALRAKRVTSQAIADARHHHRNNGDEGRRSLDISAERRRHDWTQDSGRAAK